MIAVFALVDKVVMRPIVIKTALAYAQTLKIMEPLLMIVVCVQKAYLIMRLIAIKIVPIHVLV